jgi:hypothetical protein
MGCVGKGLLLSAMNRRDVVRQGRRLAILVLCCMRPLPAFGEGGEPRPLSRAASGLRDESAGGDRRIAIDPPTLLVDDFDGGIQNHLEGYRNTFELPPSQARAWRTGEVFHGRGGKSLRVEVDRRPVGFCGQWIHLFDMRAANPVYLDARRYAWLTFRVRGEQGGERFDIKLADRSWIQREDSVRLGSVADFLPGGVTTGWQEVAVPLDRARRINLGELGGITFDFTVPGKAVVFIDDLQFKRQLAAARPEFPEERSSTNRKTAAPASYRRAMCLGDASAASELVEFCRREKIGQLWMQLLYEYLPPTDSIAAEGRCRIRRESEWRVLLRRLHAAGIRVHALDGAPEFAAAANHAVPLAVVDTVLAFNERGDAGERFDGIHFDNEPYLLLGWEDPLAREQFLREFLELNAECQRRVASYCRRHSADGFEFGIDIPFWWQERAIPAGPAVGEVTFRGKRQPASFHCLELLDNVGIMNYRDMADGADGMIAHGQDLLDYADRASRAKVYMGVETFGAEPVPVRFVVGLPRDQFLAAIRGPGRHLAVLSRLAGLRLHRFDDGRNLHVGVELPATMSAASEASVREALTEIVKHFGAAGDPDGVAAGQRRQQQAAVAIGRDAAWRKFAPLTFQLDRIDLPVAGFSAESVMLPKITFADNSRSEFELQTNLAEQSFAESASYGGMAIHCYESFRQLGR